MWIGGGMASRKWKSVRRTETGSDELCQTGKKWPLARPMQLFRVVRLRTEIPANLSFFKLNHPSAMAITRYNRGSEFDLLCREMSRLFDDFVPTRTSETQESSVWAPRA